MITLSITQVPSETEKTSKKNDDFPIFIDDRSIDKKQGLGSDSA